MHAEVGGKEIYVAYDLSYTGSTDDDQRYVVWLMQIFWQARTRRVNFEPQWEEAAALCLPEYRNSFAFGHVRPPGVKYTEFQIDPAGSIASHRFGVLCDALITPHNMMWSRVRPDNDDLMKDRAAQLYYDKVSEVLWNHRYRPEANFFSHNQQNWLCLGVFGNMGMYVDEYDSRPGDYRPGLRYCATSPGEIYILRNHQGREHGHIRHFRWTAQQAALKFGMDKVGPVLQSAIEKESRELYNFLQFVIPNTAFDPMQMFTRNAQPWASIYISYEGRCILSTGGYRTYPRASGGYFRAPEEDYDRGPAQMVLPALKTLNAIAAMFLKANHKAAEPAYLLSDNGLTDLKTAPNSFNFGGLNEQGEMLVKMLEQGNLQAIDAMQASQLKYVSDAFLTGLYPILQPPTEKQQPLNARQVIENAVDRGMFLAPTLGRQYTDYVPGIVDRELSILGFLSGGLSDRERSARGLLPKPPGIVMEARGEYKLQYVSPLAKAMNGQGIASYLRLIEQTGAIIQQGGDPALMDSFDFDTALPEMADDTFVPVRWMADDKKKQEKAKQRADAQERENQVKELPGKAAIIKAQAIQAKAGAGQNIGGTLSGVPSGQMPMMPGQSQPGGSAFGQPGAQ